MAVAVAVAVDVRAEEDGFSAGPEIVVVAVCVAVAVVVAEGVEGQVVEPFRDEHAAVAFPSCPWVGQPFQEGASPSCRQAGTPSDSHLEVSAAE